MIASDHLYQKHLKLVCTHTEETLIRSTIICVQLTLVCIFVHISRNAGLSYGEWTTHFTYLFLSVGRPPNTKQYVGSK